ncbi:hypothetical protein ACIA8H_36905 [Streptomyces goshikiensis]|uniref:hypothetical protein n=1 Tax=Streptomyces goshikiensis TaxID=1942 RepID=UPI00379D6578
MNHPKGSPSFCREALIAYLAALTFGIVLVILGVSPSAVITVALGVSVLYEKFGTSSQRESSRSSALNQKSAANLKVADDLIQTSELSGNEISGDAENS